MFKFRAPGLLIGFGNPLQISFWGQWLIMAVGAALLGLGSGIGGGGGE